MKLVGTVFTNLRLHTWCCPLSGAESYEELESRGQRIRQILDSTDSFHSDTPTNALQRGEGGGGWRGGGGDTLSSVSQEGRVMVAFTLKEVRVAVHRLDYLYLDIRDKDSSPRIKV